MKKILSVLLVVAFLFSFVSPVKAFMPEEKFKWLLENKIVEGRSGGDLALDKTITRSEVAKIIVVSMEKLTKINHRANHNAFSDVPKSHWANHFISLANQNGWVKGKGDGKFYPSDEITVKEVLAIVERSLLGQTNLSWKEGVEKYAKDNNLLDEVSTPLNEKATRKDTFTIMVNALDAKDKDVKEAKSEETIVFTDDAGRKVSMKKDIQKIGAAGNPATLFLYTIAPEKLIAVSSNPKGSSSKYFLPTSRELIEWGNYYGSKSTLNKEEIIKINPDLVIDFGQKKKTIVEDLDKIQEETGIPIIFINGDIDNLKDAYLKLGKLLNIEERASKQAEYIEKVIKIADKSKALNKITFYVGDGKQGSNTNHKGNAQAQAFDRIGLENVIVLSDKRDRGGNEVSLENLITLKPEILFFYSGSIKNDVKKLDVWKDLDAVKNNRVYEIPNLGFNWIGRPTTVNNILGMVYASKVAHPEIMSDNEFKSMIKEFYQKFMHYTMLDKEVEEIYNNIFRG